MESFYYDLSDNKQYKSFGNNFGDYLEQWAHDELAKIFPSSEVLLNPFRGDNPNEEAADVLVAHENDLYIIECKTGKLPLETREGKYDPIESVEKNWAYLQSNLWFDHRYRERCRRRSSL